MVIFIGCSENDIIDEGEKPEDPQAEIEVYYDQESTSSRKPDAGAKVYLYYNINITTAFGGLASAMKERSCHSTSFPEFDVTSVLDFSCSNRHMVVSRG